MYIVHVFPKKDITSVNATYMYTQNCEIHIELVHEGPKAYTTTNPNLHVPQNTVIEALLGGYTWDLYIFALNKWLPLYYRGPYSL